MQIDKFREDSTLYKHQTKIDEGEKIKEKQVELIAEYNKGKDEAQKDYKILITPYLYYNDNFFRKKTVAGYRYHLLIKGAPAFEPKDIVVSTEAKWDEDVKKALIGAVNTAIDIAQKQLYAIDSEVSQFEIKKISK